MFVECFNTCCVGFVCPNARKINMLCMFSAFRDTITVSTLLFRLSIGSIVCCIYLAYVLYFVLHDFCIVCISTYIVNAVNVVLCAAKLKLLQDCKNHDSVKTKHDWINDLLHVSYNELKRSLKNMVIVYTNANSLATKPFVFTQREITLYTQINF